MRDLAKYQNDYNEQPYESYQKGFRKQKIIQILKQRNFQRENILEVGCGTDSIFNYLDDFKSFIVLEPGDIFYDRAISQKMEHPLKNRIKVYNSYLENQPSEVKGVDFDLVIVSCLLHEIEDQITFLESLKKYLNSNTLVYFDVPNAFSFHRILAYEMGLIPTVFSKSESQKSFQQNEIFSVQSFCEFLEENGFQILEHGTFIFKPFTHRQMQALIDIGFLDTKLLDGLISMGKYLPNNGSEIYAICKL